MGQYERFSELIRQTQDTEFQEVLRQLIIVILFSEQHDRLPFEFEIEMAIDTENLKEYLKRAGLTVKKCEIIPESLVSGNIAHKIEL